MLKPRPLHNSRSGFGIAPVLYLLGLIGVGAGVLFSGYSQILRSNQQLSNDIATKNDLQANATTLSASSVLDTTNEYLCPPQGGGAGPNCTAAVTKMAPIAGQAQLPAPSGGGSLATFAKNAGGTDPPVEVGVFAAGAGLKQLDPYGHLYIYCRWENPTNPGSNPDPNNPAIMIISAGPDGTLQTKCTDSAAKGDDLIIEWSVPTSINRSAVWQTTQDSNGNTTGVNFGQTGHQLNVDAEGDLSVIGSTTLASGLFAKSGVDVGPLGSPNLSIDASGDVFTGGSLNVTSSTLLSGGLTVVGTTTLGPLSASTSTISTLGVTNDETVGGTLGVTGVATLGAPVNAVSGINVGPVGSPEMTIDGSGNILTASGNITTTSGTITSGNLSVTGSSSLAAVSASSLSAGALSVSGPSSLSGFVTIGTGAGAISIGSSGAISSASGTVTVNGGFAAGGTALGSLTVSGATALSGGLTGDLNGSGNATFAAGTVTAQQFSGPLTGNVTGTSTNVTGIVALANGGTGLSETSNLNLLGDLGARNASNLNSGTLASGLFGANSVPGNAIESNTVTMSQLDQTGIGNVVDAGFSIGADGRIYSYTAPINNTINDGSGDGVNVGSSNGGMIYFETAGTIWDVIDSHGNLGIGTEIPRASLDISQRTDDILLPVGSTGQRPTGIAGALRFNSTSDVFEGYNGTAWQQLASLTNNQLTFNPGTVTAPGLSVVGDASTGMYQGLHGTVSVTAEGTEVTRFLSSAGPTANYTTFAAAIAGYGPTFAVDGSDTNIPLNITTKGTGTLNLSTAGGGNIVLSPTGANVDIASGKLGLGTASPQVSLDMSAKTDALALPSGNTSQEPVGPINGEIRYNTDIPDIEAYINNAWTTLTTGGDNASIYLGSSQILPNPSAGPSDTETGLYTAGFGKVDFTSNGSQVAEISSAGMNVVLGNVGIGTNLPTGILDVEAGTSTLGNGTNIKIVAQNGLASGVTNGGNIILMPGVASGTGTPGAVGVGTLTPYFTTDVRGTDTTAYVPISTARSNPFFANPVAVGVTNSNNLSGDAAYLFLSAANSGGKADAAWIGAVSNNGSNSPTLIFGMRTGTGYAERMRIDQNGSLGIGTTSIGSNAALAVNGGLAVGTYANTGIAAQTNGIISSGSVGIGTNAPISSLDLSHETDAVALPVGTTGQEPASPVDGMIRYNSTINDLEAYIGTAWTTLTTGGDSASIYLGTSTANPDPQASATDTNTGLYTAGTGKVDFTSVGTQVAEISSAGFNLITGRVGLGTTAPKSELDVSGGVSIGTSYAGAFVAPTSGAIIQGKVGIGTSAPLNNLDLNGGMAVGSSYVGVATAPSNGALIQGAVGVGTTTLATNAKLAVSGGAAFGTYGGNAITLPANALVTSGSVGIGSATPQSSLDLSQKTDAVALPVGTTGQEPALPTNGMIRYNTTISDLEAYIGGYWTTLTTGGDNASIYLGSSAALPNPSASATDTQTGLYTAGPGKVDFTSAGSQIAEVSSAGLDVLTGKVGLGTTTPKSELDVFGGAAIGTGYAGLIAAPTSGLIVQGNVGIGTTNPAYALDVASGGTVGSIISRGKINETASDQGVQIGYGPSGDSPRFWLGNGTATQNWQIDNLSGTMRFFTPNNVVMQLSLNSNMLGINGGVSIGSSYYTTAPPSNGVLVQGNLGIGTSLPGAALEVSGTGAKFSGTLAAETHTDANAYLGVYATTPRLILGGTTTQEIDNSNGTFRIYRPGANEFAVSATGMVGIGSAAPQSSLDLSQKTDAVALPVGTTGQEPTSPTNGMIRYNTTISDLEAYIGGYWTTLTTGGDNASIYLGSSALLPNPAAGASDTQTGLYTAGPGKVDFTSTGNQIAEISAGGLNVVTGKVGLGTTAPKSELDINGGATIGAGNAGIIAAPTNGLLVQGNVGIGTQTPSLPLDVEGNSGVQVLNIRQINSSGYATAQFQDNAGATQGGIGYGNTGALGPWQGSFYLSAPLAPMAFITNALERMRITNGGKVGIGTTSPSNLFDLSGAMAIGSSYVGVVTAPANGALVQGNVGIGTTALGTNTKLAVNGGAAFGTYASNATAGLANGVIVSGSVGIGSAAPQSSLDLSQKTDAVALPVGTTGQEPTSPTNGMIRYNTTISDLEAYIGGYWTTLTTGGDNASIYLGSSALLPNPAAGASDTQTGLYTAGPGKVDVTSTGNQIAEISSAGLNVVTGKVGLGTTTPKSELDVFGGAAIGTSYAGITAAPTSGLIVQGNVGIGTAAPVTSLHVVNGGPSGQTLVNNAGALIETNGSNNSYYAFQVASGAGRSFSVTNAGNVGIGVNPPSDKLDVYGGIGISTTTATIPTNGIYSASTNQLSLTTNGSAKMTVASTGLVGIGTSSPSNLLDVSGAVAIGSSFVGITTAPANGALIQGGVGIGTTALGTNSKLAVNGAAAFGSYGGNATTVPANSLIVSGTVGIGSAAPQSSLDLSQKTDAVALPVGTTGQEPALPTNGMIRYNTTISDLEAYIGGYWTTLTTGGDNASIYLGSSALLPNPAAGATDTQTGLYTAGPGKVDFTSKGSQIVEISTTGLNILSGGEGIGTSTLGANVSLGVAGGLSVGSYASNATAASSNGLIVSGSVGIGTAIPTGALQVYSGTQTTSIPALTINQTWNNAATVFDAPLFMNVTNLASASTSNLVDLQVGGTSQFFVSKVGNTTALGTILGSNLQAGSGGTFSWSSRGYLTSPAAGQIQLGQASAAAPVAQTLSVQNVVTGTLNTAGANFTIAGSQGTGTGTGGSILFQTAPATGSGSTPNALATAMTILGTGKIGVGTTTPASTLSVYGGGLAVGSYAGANTAASGNIIASGSVGIGSAVPQSSLDLSQKTDAVALPVGTTGQEPTSPTNGMIRYNTTISDLEAYIGGYWTTLTTGGAGASIYLGTSTAYPDPQASATDTNTGLYTAGPGKVDVTSKGTQIAEISTTGLNVVTGNVGIGTTTAYAPLTVVGSANISGTTTLGSGLANNLVFIGTATGNSPSIISSGSDTNVGLNINAKGTGNVNINVATYNAVNFNNTGENWVQVNASGRAGIMFRGSSSWTQTANTNGLYFLPGYNVNGATSAVFTNNGNFEVGENSPTTNMDFATLGVMDNTATIGSSRLMVQAGPGQSTKNLFEIRGYNATYSSGTLQDFISSTGAMSVGTSALGTNVELAVNGGAAFGTYGGNAAAVSSNALVTSGSVGIGSAAPQSSLDLSQKTDAVALPVGTTGQEPASPTNGMIRYNSTISDLEAYIGGYWTTLTTGGTSASIYLGTSAAAPDPAASATDTQTGFYTAGPGKVDVTSKGTQVIEIATTGMNVVSGAVNIGTTVAQTNYSLTSTGGIYGASSSGSAAAIYGSNSNATGYGIYAAETTTSGTQATGAGAAIYAIETGAGNGAATIYAANNGTSTTGAAGYFTTASSLAGGAIVATNTNISGGTAIYASGNTAVYGNGGNGGGSGIYGNNANSSSYGVTGNVSASGSIAGIFTNTYAGAGEALQGIASGTSNTGYAVYGSNTGGGAVVNYGGYFTTNATGAAVGLSASETGASNTGYAGYFTNNSATGWSVYSAAGRNYFNGNVGIGSTAPQSSLDLSQRTDAVALPVGTTGQEPAAPTNGMIRYNSTISDLEAYIGGYWTTLTTGGTSASIYLGTSAATPDPAASATDTQTGFYTAGPGKVDVTSKGTQVIEIATTGINVVSGSVNIGTTVSQTNYSLNSVGGIYGSSSNASGNGVYGRMTAANNSAAAGYFTNTDTSASNNYGVYGITAGTGSQAAGIYGECDSANCTGIKGYSANGTGINASSGGNGPALYVFGAAAPTSYGSPTAAYVLQNGANTAYPVSAINATVNFNNALQTAAVIGNAAGGGSNATFGVQGQTNSTGGYGVYGVISAGGTNTGYAGYFANQDASGNNTGLFGTTATTGTGTGVSASETGASNTGYAVYGYNSGGGAVANYGGYFKTNATGAGYGLYASETGASNTGYAGYFTNSSTTGWGVYSAAGRNYFNGNVGIGSTNPQVSLDLSQKTDALALPVGTTGQEPASPTNGMLRYNSSISDLEAYIGGYWTSITTGGSGASIYLGTSAATPDPAASATDTQTGFYTASAGKVDVTSKGTQVVEIATTGMNVVSGAVNIGTTTAGANAKLAVNGGAAFGSYGGNATAAPTNGLVVSGNVGIGTAIAGQPLDVVGNERLTGNIMLGTGQQLIPTSLTRATIEPQSGNNQSDLVIEPSGANTLSNIYLAGDSSFGSSQAFGSVSYSANGLSFSNESPSGGMSFYVNAIAAGPAAMTIGSTALVGIGTTAPGANARLAVNGGVAVGTYGSNGTVGVSNGLIVSGSVGIGSAVPQSSLDLSQKTDAVALPVGTTGQEPAAPTNGMIRYNTTIADLEAYIGGAWTTLTTGGDNATIYLGSSKSLPNLAASATDTQTGFYTAAPGKVDVTSSNTQVVEISTTGLNLYTGKVGLGTSAPKSELDVAGGQSIGSYAGVTAAPSNGLIISGLTGIGTTLPASALSVVGGGLAVGTYGATSSAANGNILASGSVGVGTATPASALSVVGGGLAVGTYGSTSVAASGNGIFSGSVGIGTATPASALSVVGGGISVGNYGSTATAANGNILASGSVGIGSAVPQSSLDLSQKTDAVALPVGTTGQEPVAPTNGMIRYNSSIADLEAYIGGAWTTLTTGGDNATIYLGSSKAQPNLAASATDTQTGFYTAGPGKVDVTSTNTQVVEISTTGLNVVAGSVGIGTSLNGANSKLAVNGGVAIGTYAGAGSSAPTNGLISSGSVGIGTAAPQATLDVNGYVKLAFNSSQPIACSASNQGSIALTHLARPCLCTTSNSWSDMVTGGACAW